MKRLHGLAAAPGVARAPGSGSTRHLLRPAAGRRPARGPAGGKSIPSRLQARSSVSRSLSPRPMDLESISRDVRDDGHPDEAAIFVAQAAHRPRSGPRRRWPRERIKDAHRRRDRAPIQAAAGSFAEQLRSLDDELLAARAADVLDVGDRIARRLAGHSQPTGTSSTGRRSSSPTTCRRR